MASGREGDGALPRANGESRAGPICPKQRSAKTTKKDGTQAVSSCHFLRPEVVVEEIACRGRIGSSPQRPHSPICQSMGVQNMIIWGCYRVGTTTTGVMPDLTRSARLGVCLSLFINWGQTEPRRRTKSREERTNLRHGVSSSQSRWRCTLELGLAVGSVMSERF